MKVSPYLSFKLRKALVEACLISHLRYGVELYSQGTEKQMRRMEGLLSRGARIILQSGRGPEWSKTRGLQQLGWLSFIQMAAATSVKTMLKVLHHKIPQNLYSALMIEPDEGPDRIRSYTKRELDTMTKLERKSWAVRCLRWYSTLPRELRTMKPGTDAWKNRVNAWARRTVKGVNGDKVFRGEKPPQDSPPTIAWVTNNIEEETPIREETTNIKAVETLEHEDREQMRMDVMTEEEQLWLEDELQLRRILNLVEWAGFEEEYTRNS